MGARHAVRTGWARLAGPPPVDRLSSVHLVQAVGDGLFAVSLAGSLFFNVSLEASRGRIILYLVLTMAPFAVLAPLVGPVIDRLRGGYRGVVMGTMLGRAALCLLLVGGLRTLFLYPEALGVLVLGKTYSVAKAALVPRLVPDPLELVAANARLSRLSAVGGAIGGAAGAAAIVLADSRLSVGLAAAVFLIAAIDARRLPRPAAADAAAPGIQFEELHLPSVVLGAAAMTVLRLGVGFLTFFAAFELKRSGAPAWVFGLVAVASGAAAIGGTLLGPYVRKRVREPMLLAAALAVPAAASLAMAAGAGAAALVVAAAAIGLGGNVGRQAFDTLVQRHAPDAERGRAFAGFETRFQLAWVAGALGPVLLLPPTWAGMLSLGLLLGLGAGAYVVAERTASEARVEARATTLPGAVLAEAHRLRSLGAHDHAVLEAALAAEACARRCSTVLDPRLAALRDAVLAGTSAGGHESAMAVELAERAVLTAVIPPAERSAPPSSGHPNPPA